MEKNINLTLSKSKTQDEKNRHRVGENIYTAPIHRAQINDKYSAHKELSTLNYMKQSDFKMGDENGNRNMNINNCLKCEWIKCCNQKTQAR